MLKNHNVVAHTRFLMPNYLQSLVNNQETELTVINEILEQNLMTKIVPEYLFSKAKYIPQ